VRARDRWLLAALTIAAAALRFATIDVQSYWFDEALTAKLVAMPFGDMLHDIPRTELTPPLYYVLAWPWAHVIGTQEAALRALSALFGIAAVPVAWLIGRELVSRTVGLFAAALVAFNPLLVWYSQEARPYSLLMLLAALSLLFAARAARLRSARELGLWALASALALLTHYFAAFLVVPEAIWLVWLWRPPRAALIAGAAVALVGAALVPLAAYERSRIGTGYISSLSLPRRVVGVPEDFLTGFVVKWDTLRERLFDLVAVAAAAVGAWLLVRRADAAGRRAALVLGAAVAAAAGVPAALALAGADFLNTRNVIAACVPALVLLAVGFGAAHGRRSAAHGRRSAAPAVGLAGAAVLCFVGVAAVVVVAADVDYHRSDFRAAARSLGRPPPREARALVVPSVAGEIAFGQYVPGLSRMPGRGQPVAEVDLVTVHNSRLGGPRPAVAPRVRGFALVERRYAATYTLLRYRAARGAAALAVPGVLARAAAPVLGNATVLVQGGRSPA
jgi:mannosyltransferase